MKKLYCFLFLIFLLNLNVYATGGTIRQDSIIKCNGKYYGSHGHPVHFHLVEKKDGKWVSISGEVSIPPCYIEPVNEKEKVVFSKCVDGDTARFIIKSEERIVRFLAIDTPESVHPEKESEPYAKEASDYTCNRLSTAQEIYLEYDGNSDKEDKYGRVLAFVYVDGELLEEKLIERGLAKVDYIYGDYAHVDELRKKEEEAKEKKNGIWSDIYPDVMSSEEKNDNSKENDSLEKIISLIWELLKKIIDLLVK